MKRVTIDLDSKSNRFTMKEATPGNAEVSEDILKEWQKHQQEWQKHQADEKHQAEDQRWQEVLGDLYRKEGQ